jgi:hypothetical protein
MEEDGGLYCYLNAKQVDRQFYATHFNFEWGQLPSNTPIQTAHGLKSVEHGIIIIKDSTAKSLDGKPYREPKIAIIVDAQ